MQFMTDTIGAIDHSAIQYLTKWLEKISISSSWASKYIYHLIHGKFWYLLGGSKDPPGPLLGCTYDWYQLVSVPVPTSWKVKSRKSDSKLASLLFCLECMWVLCCYHGSMVAMHFVTTVSDTLIILSNIAFSFKAIFFKCNTEID